MSDHSPERGDDDGRDQVGAQLVGSDAEPGGDGLGERFVVVHGRADRRFHRCLVRDVALDGEGVVLVDPQLVGARLEPVDVTQARPSRLRRRIVPRLPRRCRSRRR
jgi:hypothetical protein